jgi:hypothetical protein
MYRPVAAEDAYGKHATFSHDETLRKALFRATFLTFTVNFHPLDWEKIQIKEPVALVEDEEFWESELGQYISAEADDSVSVEEVRKALSAIPGSLAEEIS